MNRPQPLGWTRSLASLMLAAGLACATTAATPAAQAPAPPAADQPGREGAPPSRGTNAAGKGADKGAPAIQPPFLPNAGAAPRNRGNNTGTMPKPYLEGARQFLVQPGQIWQHLIEDIRPGDEVIFPAGFHMPQVITDLHGTADRPIFLRSRDPVPAAVGADPDGWVFVRPKHVVVENIMFLNPLGAAVVVDGSNADGTGGLFEAQFTIRNCTVTTGHIHAGQDAVRVRNASDVTVDQVRVDGWNDAAVEIVDARRVLVRGLMMVPSTTLSQSFGIKVEGRSGQISITGCSFNKVVQTGVRIGTDCPGGDRAAAPPVEQLRVDRCLFENPGQLLELVNARDVMLSRATVVNPTAAIYSIPESAGTVEGVVIDKCLAFWFPGTLAKFSPHPDRIPSTAVTLGDNLWYSVELPLAWDAIGAPFGYQASTQHIAPDPGIDITTLRPRNGEAIRYGAYSNAAPAAGGNPAVPPDAKEPPAVQRPTDQPAKPRETAAPASPAQAPSSPSPPAP